MKKIIKIIIVVVIIMILTILLGLYIKNLREKAYAKILINGQEILISKNTTTNEFDLQTLNNKHDTTLSLEANNAKVKINGEEVKNKEQISLGKLNINNDNKIKIEFKVFGDIKYKEYIVNTLPSIFPKYKVETKKGQEEDYEYYVSTYILNSKKNKNYIFNINLNGDVTFYRETKSTAYNFKKNEIDGKIRYTYLERTPKMYGGINDAVPCRLIVLDEKYNEIDNIGYFVNEEEIDTECHDYYYLGENHYIIAGYTEETVNNVPELEGQGINIWNCRIQEVKDGNILWEFQSIENKELYENYNPVYSTKIGNYREPINYMHFNSMEIDPLDGNLICSFRNQDSIIKINRTTGKIMWTLGGKGDEFGLKEEQKFCKQHAISYLQDHSILIFDNQENRANARILIIKVNEETKKIEEYKSYDLGARIPRMGSVEAIDEKQSKYLLCYGSGMLDCNFEELNLETRESYFKFTLLQNSSLYCVNKY